LSRGSGPADIRKKDFKRHGGGGGGGIVDLKLQNRDISQINFLGTRIVGPIKLHLAERCRGRGQGDVHAVGVPGVGRPGRFGQSRVALVRNRARRQVCRCRSVVVERFATRDRRRGVSGCRCCSFGRGISGSSRHQGCRGGRGRTRHAGSKLACRRTRRGRLNRTIAASIHRHRYRPHTCFITCQHAGQGSRVTGCSTPKIGNLVGGIPVNSSSIDGYGFYREYVIEEHQRTVT
jgi:hypothetical protein